MTRQGRVQVFATVLAAIAGYVDASGFIAFAGFFVSFMSGNSTRLSIDAVHGFHAGALAAILLGAFVLGVIVGSLVGHAAGGRRIPAVLVTVAVLVAGAAAVSPIGHDELTAAVMAASMGAMNNVFERGGEVTVGLTYMTGSLVKLGQKIVSAIVGPDRFGWVLYLNLWLGFMAGGVATALLYPIYGLSALWAVALALLALALVAWRIDLRFGP